MAWLLVSLWRKQPLGYGLAGVLLAHLVLLALAVLSMVVYMAQADQPLIMPQVVIFAILFAVSKGMLVGYLKNLGTQTRL